MIDTDDTLVKRYLTGSLTEEERAMFEERILTDPALQKEIELTHAMRAGIRELAKRGELTALLSEVRSFWGRPVLGIAASVAALFFATASILLYTRGDSPATVDHGVAAVSSATSTEVLRFQLTRSASGLPDVSWHRGPRSTSLQLELDTGIEPASDYAIWIELLSGKTIAPILELPAVSPNPDGLVLLSIHSDILIAGDYRIRLEPRAALVPKAQPMVYSMRIVD